jgi:hypothetical protein
MKPLLTICLGGIVGGILGIYVGSDFVESTFRATHQVTVIGGLATFFATLAHGIAVVVASGLIGAVLGAVLVTVASMVVFGKKAKTAQANNSPGPDESITGSFSNESESNPPTPTTSDEHD